MGSWTWRRFLNGLLFGAACGAVMAVTAVLTGYSLTQVQMRRAVATEPTPTVEQLQSFLETITAEPKPLFTPGPPAWSVGGTQPSPTVQPTTASGTPAAPAMQSTTGGARPATPSLPQLGANDATPQPTTTSPSNLAIPTRTPFVPPVIVPIQPMLPASPDDEP